MKKLSVYNFGPVSKAELILRDFNMLIGEQSVGKSTLAKLITIVTDYFSLALITSAGLNGWLYQLQNYNLTQIAGSQYRITYEFTENEISFRMTIRPDRITSYIVTSDGKRVTSKEKIRKELIGLKPNYHLTQYVSDLDKAMKNLTPDASSMEVANTLALLLYNSLYIPAERIVYSLYGKIQPALNLMKDSVPVTMLRFMVELTNAQNKFPTYESGLLNVDYLREGKEDFIVDKSSQAKIPLSASSSGIQSTLPLLMVMEYAVDYKEYSSFVVEEPETNLFPSKQVELLRYLLQKVKSGNRTVTITTHSPYLLSAMNNSLFAGSLQLNEDRMESVGLSSIPILKREDCSVYSLGESVNGEGVYCKSIIDEDSQMIDANAIDGISLSLSAEFEQLEDLYIESQRVL